MELKMCTNCGQIHRTEERQRIPKHAHIRKHTERCDVPGRAVKSCYLRKHLTKQTKAPQGKCLFHCPDARAANLPPPGRGTRKQAWSDPMESRAIRREGGQQGSDGQVRGRTGGQSRGWEEREAAGGKLKRSKRTERWSDGRRGNGRWSRCGLVRSEDSIRSYWRSAGAVSTNQYNSKAFKEFQSNRALPSTGLVLDVHPLIKTSSISRNFYSQSLEQGHDGTNISSMSRFCPVSSPRAPSGCFQPCFTTALWCLIDGRRLPATRGSFNNTLRLPVQPRTLMAKGCRSILRFAWATFCSFQPNVPWTAAIRHDGCESRS